MNTERWVDIKGYNGRYQISDRGRVRSKRKDGTYLIKKLRMNDGGNQVILHMNCAKKTVRISRLVAEHFIPNPDGLPIAYRKDGDIYNDYYMNIAWGNRSDVVCNKHTYSVVAKMDGRDILKTYKSASEAERDTGVSKSCIRRCLMGVANTAGGFKWVYVDILDEGSDVQDCYTDSSGKFILNVRCRRCRDVKPVTDFKQSNVGRNKLMHLCNDCLNKAARLRVNTKRILDGYKASDEYIAETYAIYKEILKHHPGCKCWKVRGQKLEDIFNNIYSIE